MAAQAADRGPGQADDRHQGGVAPLLAPYALAAASVARGRWDAYRAARLGVQPDQLSAYAGPGGALHARLSRVAEALTELESGTQVQPTAPVAPRPPPDPG